MKKVVISSRKKKSIEIMRIYYILDLRANLLLYRRLCMLELTDRFNINSIILYTKEKKNMLKANFEEDIYILI